MCSSHRLVLSVPIFALPRTAAVTVDFTAVVLQSLLFNGFIAQSGGDGGPELSRCVRFGTKDEHKLVATCIIWKVLPDEILHQLVFIFGSKPYTAAELRYSITSKLRYEPIKVQLSGWTVWHKSRLCCTTRVKSTVTAVVVGKANVVTDSTSLQLRPLRSDLMSKMSSFNTAQHWRDA